MNQIETFYGVVETTADALRIFQLCREGRLGRIRRRLHEKERHFIRSGSVFVFDEQESGIRRWTDGRLWSPSRILGNFLIYRELEKKRVSAASTCASGSCAAVPQQQSNSPTGMGNGPTNAASLTSSLAAIEREDFDAGGVCGKNSALFPSKYVDERSVLQLAEESLNGRDDGAYYGDYQGHQHQQQQSRNLTRRRRSQSTTQIPPSSASIQHQQAHPYQYFIGGNGGIKNNCPSDNAGGAKLDRQHDSASSYQLLTPKPSSSFSSYNYQPLALSNQYIQSHSFSHAHAHAHAHTYTYTHPNSTKKFHFKENGLIKKTISVTIQGHIHHLICYYSKGDFISGMIADSASDQLARELSFVGIPEDLLVGQNFRKAGPDEIYKRSSLLEDGDASANSDGANCSYIDDDAWFNDGLSLHSVTQARERSKVMAQSIDGLYNQKMTHASRPPSRPSRGNNHGQQQLHGQLVGNGISHTNSASTHHLVARQPQQSVRNSSINNNFHQSSAIPSIYSSITTGNQQQQESIIMAASLFDSEIEREFGHIAATLSQLTPPLASTSQPPTTMLPPITGESFMGKLPSLYLMQQQGNEFESSKDTSGGREELGTFSAATVNNPTNKSTNNCPCPSASIDQQLLHSGMGMQNSLPQILSMPLFPQLSTADSPLSQTLTSSSPIVAEGSAGSNNPHHAGIKREQYEGNLKSIIFGSSMAHPNQSYSHSTNSSRNSANHLQNNSTVIVSQNSFYFPSEIVAAAAVNDNSGITDPCINSINSSRAFIGGGLTHSHHSLLPPPLSTQPQSQSQHQHQHQPILLV